MEGEQVRRAQPAKIQAAASVRERRAHPLRAWLLGTLGMFAAAPILGVLAGFLLLWSGVFLGVAWQVGPQATIDALHFRTFTATATGRIVESWAAIDFEPSVMPKDRFNWQPRSKARRCVIVEYLGEWSTAHRRAFCGPPVSFSDSFTLHDWHLLAAGVEVDFLHEPSGFALQEVRLDKRALAWLAHNPPDSTFMLGKPPPATALAALLEQFDRPRDVAIESWVHPLSALPLRYDPRHPEAPMPAQYVQDRLDPWLAGWIFAALLCVPGLIVWRFGIRVLFPSEPSGAVLWVLTLLPLLALPWWGEALPALIARANRNWAEIASDMLEDITRSTISFSEASAARQANGERIVWHVGRGEYAATFGRIGFVRPDPAPKTPADAIAALDDQASAEVATLSAREKLALVQKLNENKQNGRDRDQEIFIGAVEAIARDANASPELHQAARHFLIFSAGKGEWEVDALEKSWRQATP